MKHIKLLSTIILFTGLFVLTFSSCKKDAKNPQQVELAKNLKKWQKTLNSNYHFNLTISCGECAGGRFAITVINNVIITVKNNEGENIGFSIRGFQTIDELFIYIKTSLDSNPYKAEIKYHSEFGYPESTYFDFEKGMIDDEMGYTINEFTKTP